MVSDVDRAALIGCAIGVAVFVLLSAVLWLWIRASRKPKKVAKEPAREERPRQRTDVRRNARPVDPPRRSDALWSMSSTTTTRGPFVRPTAPPQFPDLGELLRPLDRAIEDLQRQVGHASVGTMAHLQQTIRNLHADAAEIIRTESVNVAPGERRVIERNGLRITISNNYGELHVEATSNPGNPRTQVADARAAPPPKVETPKKTAEPKVPNLYERILQNDDEYEDAACPTTSAEVKKNP